MNYKIVNGKVLLSGQDGFYVEEKTLYVQDGVISFIEKENTEYETVDAKRKLVMPGLINMHTHVYMSLMRNYADDVDFGEWLFNRCMPVEDRLPREAAYWTTQLGILEMYMTGTTSYVDMHCYPHACAQAAKDAGIRAFIGRGLVGSDVNTDGKSRWDEFMDERAAFQSELLQYVVSPHAIYSCSPHYYAQLNELAAEYGMLKQTHVSEGMTEIENCLKEYGKTPVEVLYETGFLDDKAFIAHCVQMQGNDLDIIAKAGTSIVSNPASNAKLSNGFAPVQSMKEKGINVCLGTDGPASNNTLNMFREMGLLSLIHKGIHRDSTVLPAQFVVGTATTNAAKALHQEGKLGVITEGAKADMIFLDLDAPSMFPNNNILSSLCYSANGSEVDSVMVAGKFVMRKGELLTLDKERIYYEVNKIAQEIL